MSGRVWGENLALAIGGAFVGTFIREGLELTFPAGSGAWPWTTFLINLSGAFILGTLLGFLSGRGEDHGRRRRIRLFAGTGVLGGYTTYSTFMLEVVKLGQVGAVWVSAAYLLGSIFLGLVFAGLGLTLGAHLARSVPAGGKADGAA